MTKGIKALQRYLIREHTTPHGFSLANGFNPSEIAKLLRGEKSRVTVDMAVAIEDATDGEVGHRLWCSSYDG